MDMLRQAHEDTLAQVKTIADRVERVRTINAAIQSGSDLSVELAAIKRETVREMVAESSYEETARKLGVGKSRVEQIVNGRRVK